MVSIKSWELHSVEICIEILAIHHEASSDVIRDREAAQNDYP